MKKRLEAHAPLGIDTGVELALYFAGMFFATMQSLNFLFKYLGARNELYRYIGGEKVLIEGAVIQSFESLAEGAFLFAQILCVVTLLVTIYHYMYHYQGSKMMYLMKRLPDKWEVHRRCLTLPVAGAVLMMVWAFVLRMCYYAIYMLCTPNQCLPL
jgi:hypothetical protein